MLRFLAAAGAALCIVFAGAPAHAGDPALGKRVISAVLTAPGVEDGFAKAITEGVASGLGANSDFPPEWNPLFVEAAREEALAKKEVFATVLGALLARNMTDEELQAGVALMENAYTRTAIAASLSGGKAKLPEPTAAERRELDKLMKSKGMQGFTSKMQVLGRLDAQTKTDLIRALAPGMLRRFGEKAEAFEAARAR